MRFADVIGHEAVKESLRSMVDGGRLPHAILIGGPTGIGKMNLARALAQYVHCKHRESGDSCGQCASCKQHERRNNPDLKFIYPVIKKASPKRGVSDDYAEQWGIYLDANPYMPYEGWLTALDAGNSQPAIYVDETESILNIAALSPYSEDYKILIIWLPEKMRQEAANKLLKVLEEPFPDTLFFLVSDEPQNLLGTILSRTVRFNLTRLGQEEILRALEKEGFSGDVAAEGLRLSEGNIARAIEVCSQNAETLEFRDTFQQLMRLAYGRKVADLKKLSEALAAMGREKSRRFLSYFNRMVRENYMANLQIPGLTLMTRAESDFSKKFAPFIHSANVEQLMEEADRASRDVERNVNGKIVFFDFCMQVMIQIRTPNPAKQ